MTVIDKGDHADDLYLPHAAEADCEPMKWTAPAYTRRRVTEAGFTFIDPSAPADEREIALAVINNWRSSHGFPLNTMQVGLRRFTSLHDTDATVAQRIKRLPSIRSKLQRFHGMELARMQDIGGCRGVLASVDAGRAVHGTYKGSSIKHSLIREDLYIDNPKKTGYRGVHLVYRYFSDKNPTWNGLKIEVQLRSRLQHAWATAVETVDTFTQQALKSSQGEADWLRFFALMGSALALREDTPLVPDTPDDPASGVGGDLAYLVGFEHIANCVGGVSVEPYTLRVTHIFRRENGMWKIAHRHAEYVTIDQTLGQETQRHE